MVKLNKEHSDAFGFRLLSHFVSFIAEYPAEGVQIQKICDEDFKATCMKCYPIIVSTGIDPTSYSPKATVTTALKTQLREMFPIPKKPEVVMDVDESTSSTDEDEVCEIVRPTVVHPVKNYVGFKPRPAEKRPEPKPTEKRPDPRPEMPKIDLKCASCSRYATVLAATQKVIDDHEKEKKNWADTNAALVKENTRLLNEATSWAKQADKYGQELTAEKNISKELSNRISSITNNSDYIAFCEYRKFESFKRQRK